MSRCPCPHHPFGCLGHPHSCDCAKAPTPETDIDALVAAALSEVDELEQYGNATSRAIRPAITALQADLAAARAERDDARRRLFPYADDTTISGMSWNGFYLVGNPKSIKELRRIEHRSAQLEQFSTAYDESKKQLAARAEAAETSLAEALTLLALARTEIDYSADTAREHDLVARIDALTTHRGSE